MAGNMVFDLSCSMFTEYTKDGFINVQVDADGSGATAKDEPTVPPFEVHHPYGLISRPRDPALDANGKNPVGCTVLYGWEGDRGHAWFMSDPRVAAKLPNTIEQGGLMLFAHRDDGLLSIQRLRGTDGAFILHVPSKNGNGRGSQLQIDNDDGFDLSNPWGRAQLGPKGFSVTLTCGASFRMGPIGGFPDPVGPIMEAANIASRATIKAGAVSLSGGLVSIGTDGGVANETGLASLLATMTAVVTALTEISATPAAIGAPVFTPAQLAPVAAALAAFTTAINGIGKHI